MTADESDEEGLTYADAGVDIAESDAAVDALVAAVDEFDTDAYAGLLDIGDRYLGLATDGVGTKLLVAEAIEAYDTVGIDCIAMNVNDLVAMGVEPLGFVDYLAVDAPDEDVARAIGTGLAAGADEAGIALLGGETAVLPEIVTGFDLAGTAVGIATAGELFAGEAKVGDHLVGFPATGIHSNGLTLARAAATNRFDYGDPFPPDPDRTIGEVLLEPTALYTDLLGPLRAHDARAAVHVTGGGWTNLSRIGTYRYRIDDPWPVPTVFAFIQEEGDVATPEMYRTFNMGTGFVAVVPPSNVDGLLAETDGRLIGEVEAGDGVAIGDLEL